MACAGGVAWAGGFAAWAGSGGWKGRAPRPQQLAGVTPPTQPTSGPGGSTYAYASVSSFETGSDADGAVVYVPEPRPTAAVPVIGFLHGWGAMSPSPYQGWIDHLVRRGSVVIYPRYQARLRDPIPGMTDAAGRGFAGALAKLKEKGVKVDLTKFALAGHSLGGAIAPNLAARYKSRGLPEPKALFLAEPGDANARAKGIQSLLEDLSAVPPATLVVIVVGDEDRIVRQDSARRILSGLTSISATQKNLLLMHSDYRGTPALVANHFAPLSKEPDALDYYGFWKLLDALTDAAFYGKNRAVALGGGPEQLGLGLWSDGTPVRAMELLKE